MQYGYLYNFYIVFLGTLLIIRLDTYYLVHIEQKTKYKFGIIECGNNYKLFNAKQEPMYMEPSLVNDMMIL